MKTCRVLLIMLPNGEAKICGAPAIRLFLNQPICLSCWLKTKVLEKTNDSA